MPKPRKIEKYTHDALRRGNSLLKACVRSKTSGVRGGGGVWQKTNALKLLGRGRGRRARRLAASRLAECFSGCFKISLNVFKISIKHPEKTFCESTCGNSSELAAYPLAEAPVLPAIHQEAIFTLQEITLTG